MSDKDSASSESKTLKILVSGDVEGRLNDLYSKVRTIQSKAGKFDLLFCVGEFFAESNEDNVQIEECISNPESIPITTYIIGTSKSSRSHHFRDSSGYDLCRDKIIYLGSKGLYTTGQGLSVAYLSGVEEKVGNDSKRAKSEKADSSDPITFSDKDVENLIANCERRLKSANDCVDILLTSQWPMYIEKQSNQTIEGGLSSDKFGSEWISYLAIKIKPRYHFSALQNVFFERIPYRNHQVLAEKDKALTRFLALAKANKANKPKFLYAFNIMPAKKMSSKDLCSQQSGSQVSDCPYLNNITVHEEELKQQQKKASNDEATLQYFYDAGHIKKMTEINEKAMNEKKRKMEERQNKEQEPCWFCLGGSKVERHYIVSVGDKCYLAYAKGAINKDHLLIIPIDHIQSTINADDKLLEDINKYKMALKKYFQKKNKIVIFFERNFRTKHMQIQVFAIGCEKAYLLKDAFMSLAKEQDVRLNEIPQFTNLKQVLRPNNSFFYLELPSDEDDGKEDKYVCERYLSEIRSHNFPMNFGRDVIASELIMNVPERVDWKTCVKSQEEEKQMSVEFRNDFKKFDPFV